MGIPDNYDIWHDHQSRLDQELLRRPVCSHCEDPVQEDHCYEVAGQILCPHCLETYFRKELDIQ